MTPPTVFRSARFLPFLSTLVLLGTIITPTLATEKGGTAAASAYPPGWPDIDPDALATPSSWAYHEEDSVEALALAPDYFGRRTEYEEKLKTELSAEDYGSDLRGGISAIETGLSDDELLDVDHEAVSRMGESAFGVKGDYSDHLAELGQKLADTDQPRLSLNDMLQEPDWDDSDGDHVTIGRSTLEVQGANDKSTAMESQFYVGGFHVPFTARTTTTTTTTPRPTQPAAKVTPPAGPPIDLEEDGVDPECADYCKTGTIQACKWVDDDMGCPAGDGGTLFGNWKKIATELSAPGGPTAFKCCCKLRLYREVECGGR